MKKYSHIWLVNYNFVYEKVLFIPCNIDGWSYLSASRWDDINSTIRGML